MTAAAAPLPFAIDVPDAILDRIQAKLALSEAHYAPADDSGWSYGTDAKWLAGLVDYWREKYDWRAAERALNRCPLFKATVDGIEIHFIHVRGHGGRGCLPLLLTHGWPGSFFEFHAAILPLVEQGFDVVVPSLLGYAFSGRPALPIGPRRVAAMWRTLMIDVLGYATFGAQGGDWGSVVATWLGRDDGDVSGAIHLNLFMAPAETSATMPKPARTELPCRRSR